MTEPAKKEISREMETATHIPRLPASFKEWERMFEDFMPRRWVWPFQMDWPTWMDMTLPFNGNLPKVDVIERDGEVVVRAEVPGVEKKDLDVTVTDNTVTLKGRTTHEQKEEKGDYYRSEISRGSFARTVTLPAEVEGPKAQASFKEGMLELVIPKVHKSDRHSVKIN